MDAFLSHTTCLQSNKLSLSPHLLGPSTFQRELCAALASHTHLTQLQGSRRHLVHQAGRSPPKEMPVAHLPAAQIGWLSHVLGRLFGETIPPVSEKKKKKLLGQVENRGSWASEHPSKRQPFQKAATKGAIHNMLPGAWNQRSCQKPCQAPGTKTSREDHG